MTTYIDIHALQTVPPSNINRDDTGAPKSAQFGGVRRARVSSQAWKRATRAEFNAHLDQSELGERTMFVAERIAEAITRKDEALGDKAEEMAVEVLKATGLKVEKPKAKDGDDEEGLRWKTQYLVFVSRAQIEKLADLAIAAAEEGKAVARKDAKAALNDEHSIDVALFGRMIADAADLNVDACCQVSHAISVHAVSNEFDYFTAVDDNAAEDNLGAGMIGTVEFNSSTLYRYANVNADELAASLGSVDAAARAVEAFVKAFVVSMPTGKQNTFANRTLPDLVVVRVRGDQPVNLAEAFENPIEGTDGRTKKAAIALGRYSEQIDEAYAGPAEAGGYLATGGAAELEAQEALATFGERVNLDGLAKLAADAVQSRVTM